MLMVPGALAQLAGVVQQGGQAGRLGAHGDALFVVPLCSPCSEAKGHGRCTWE